MAPVAFTAAISVCACGSSGRGRGVAAASPSALPAAASAAASAPATSAATATTSASTRVGARDATERFDEKCKQQWHAGPARRHPAAKALRPPPPPLPSRPQPQPPPARQPSTALHLPWDSLSQPQQPKPPHLTAGKTETEKSTEATTASGSGDAAENHHGQMPLPSPPQQQYQQRLEKEEEEEGNGAATGSSGRDMGAASTRGRRLPLPRLDRPLTDDARAALAARRVGVVVPRTVRDKIADTALRNREARRAAAAAALARRQQQQRLRKIHARRKNNMDDEDGKVDDETMRPTTGVLLWHPTDAPTARHGDASNQEVLAHRECVRRTSHRADDAAVDANRIGPAEDAHVEPNFASSTAWTQTTTLLVDPRELKGTKYPSGFARSRQKFESHYYAATANGDLIFTNVLDLAADSEHSHDLMASNAKPHMQQITPDASGSTHPASSTGKGDPSAPPSIRSNSPSSGSTDNTNGSSSGTPSARASPRKSSRTRASGSAIENRDSSTAAGNEPEDALLTPTPPTGKENAGKSGKAKREMTEVGKKISRALKGRALSEERKRKISEALRGRTLSEEHKKNLSARFGGSKNPMFGRTRSAESRAKISSAMTARMRRRSPNGDTTEPDVLDGQRPGKLQPLSRDAMKKVMESRLLSSIGKTVRERGTEAAMEELLERVAAGQVPPQAVKRLQEATKRSRAASEGKKSALGQGSRRRGRPPGKAKTEPNAGETEPNAGETEPNSGETEPDAVDPHLVAGLSSGAGPAISKDSQDRIAEKFSVSSPCRDPARLPTVGQHSGDRSMVEGVIDHSKTSRGRGRARRKDQAPVGSKSPRCQTCDGQGVVACPQCVGTVGIASRHCATCFGAASVFCPACEGSGVLT